MDTFLQEKLTACKLAGIQKTLDRILIEATEENWDYIKLLKP